LSSSPFSQKGPGGQRVITRGGTHVEFVTRSIVCERRPLTADLESKMIRWQTFPRCWWRFNLFWLPSALSVSDPILQNSFPSFSVRFSRWWSGVRRPEFCSVTVSNKNGNRTPDKFHSNLPQTWMHVGCSHATFGSDMAPSECVRVYKDVRLWKSNAWIELKGKLVFSSTIFS
jgi:hypothetical protein